MNMDVEAAALRNTQIQKLVELLLSEELDKIFEFSSIQKIVIEKYFKEGKTYQDIAVEHCITKERVRQYVDGILNKVKRNTECSIRNYEVFIEKSDMVATQIQQIKNFKDSADHMFRTINTIENKASDVFIDSVPISARLKLILQEKGYTMLYQLASLSITELKKTRNIGNKTILEFELLLRKNGIEVKL